MLGESNGRGLASSAPARRLLLDDDSVEAGRGAGCEGRGATPSLDRVVLDSVVRGVACSPAEAEAREAAHEAADGCTAWSLEAEALKELARGLVSQQLLGKTTAALPSASAGRPPHLRSGAIDATFTCVDAEVEQLQLALQLATHYAHYSLMQAQSARFSSSAASSVATLPRSRSRATAAASSLVMR